MAPIFPALNRLVLIMKFSRNRAQVACAGTTAKLTVVLVLLELAKQPTARATVPVFRFGVGSSARSDVSVNQECLLASTMRPAGKLLARRFENASASFPGKANSAIGVDANFSLARTLDDARIWKNWTNSARITNAFAR